MGQQLYRRCLEELIPAAGRIQVARHPPMDENAGAENLNRRLSEMDVYSLLASLVRLYA